jgi:hypothetical protein
MEHFKPFQDPKSIRHHCVSGSFTHHHPQCTKYDTAHEKTTNIASLVGTCKQKLYAMTHKQMVRQASQLLDASDR